jgi:protein arginine kinase
MENWMNTTIENNDIVLSSRIRLARNISNMPFPHKLSQQKGRELVKIVEDALFSSKEIGDTFKSIHLWENDAIENRTYFEKHLISYNLLNNKETGAVILNNDETISIMINEEDHIRIQCITAGMNLNEAYEIANNIDNILEEKLNYAFNEELGYITACPTNIGTGLRASVMMHLPVITVTNEMSGVLNALTQVGMTIRGQYGEGSKTKGNIYQVSNQITLGLSEQEILNNLKAITLQLITQENISRQNVLANYKYEFEDKVYRSFGILKSAVLIDSAECLNLLSDVRLGMEMGIIKSVDKKTLNSLLIDVQPGRLQILSGKKLTDKERDFQRAKLIREKLNSNIKIKNGGEV